jgi:hypothetical protein
MARAYAHIERGLGTSDLGGRELESGDAPAKGRPAVLLRAWLASADQNRMSAAIWVQAQ